MGRPDFRELARFVIVGCGATVIHLGVVFAIQANDAFSAIAIHAIAFFCAFSFSFIGHYYFTFASSKSIRIAVIRFLLVSLIALLLSTAIAGIGQAIGLGRLASLLVAAFSVPILSYIANKRFVF